LIELKSVKKIVTICSEAFCPCQFFKYHLVRIPFCPYHLFLGTHTNTQVPSNTVIVSQSRKKIDVQTSNSVVDWLNVIKNNYENQSTAVFEWCQFQMMVVGGGRYRSISISQRLTKWRL